MPKQQKLAAMLKKSPVFSGNFTGFELYDPQADSIIYAQNENKYFTPASNTKLYTFYTALKYLPDKIPALKYITRGDSLIFWGTGDPSFLRRDLDDGVVYHFLKNTSKKLYFSDANFRDKDLGPGWSWGDYQYSYQAERSPLPIYGNMVRFTMQKVTKTHLLSDSSGARVYPDFFRPYVKKSSTAENESNHQPLIKRGIDNNKFQYAPKSDTTTFTIKKPYHYTPQLVIKMLGDTLNKPVTYINRKMPAHAQTLYSVQADTVYKHMLLPSDNFIAEQLLLVTAAQLGHSLNTKWVIKKMEKTYLKGLPDKPQWVDGSGLSRYNLFTPRDMVWVLQHIRAQFNSDKNLFKLLPTGGRSGTIKNWYAPRDGGPPYVFAKTGTLKNNHCLSGFVRTKNGRLLIFSFMNNHYVSSSSVVKKAMENVLWYIHEHY